MAVWSAMTKRNTTLFLLTTSASISPIRPERAHTSPRTGDSILRLMAHTTPLMPSSMFNRNSPLSSSPSSTLGSPERAQPASVALLTPPVASVKAMSAAAPMSPNAHVINAHFADLLKKSAPHSAMATRKSAAVLTTFTTTSTTRFTTLTKPSAAFLKALRRKLQHRSLRAPSSTSSKTNISHDALPLLYSSQDSDRISFAFSM
mmetsp:Transcript_52260/g.156845  ORF Transcript_52260/g.156845 Transcript_52260/m.156845 type:complete len:204 (-) Transcript_52260:474-1085(-)